jgi:hypothetical protein
VRALTPPIPNRAPAIDGGLDEIGCEEGERDREKDSENQFDQQVPIAPDPCSDDASQITQVQKAHIGFRRLEVKLDLLRHRNEFFLERRSECPLKEIGEPKGNRRPNRAFRLSLRQQAEDRSSDVPAHARS